MSGVGSGGTTTRKITQSFYQRDCIRRQEGVDAYLNQSEIVCPFGTLPRLPMSDLCPTWIAKKKKRRLDVLTRAFGHLDRK